MFKYKAITHGPARHEADHKTLDEAADWLRQQASNGHILERRDRSEYFVVAIVKNGNLEEVAA